jgi:hypothetical protein
MHPVYFGLRPAALFEIYITYIKKILYKNDCIMSIAACFLQFSLISSWIQTFILGI